METGPYHSFINLLIIIGLIVLNGFFTAIYNGLIAINSDKLKDLKEDGNTDADRLLKITSNQDRLSQSFSMINAIISLFTIAFIAQATRQSDFLLKNISLFLNDVYII